MLKALGLVLLQYLVNTVQQVVQLQLKLQNSSYIDNISVVTIIKTDEKETQVRLFFGCVYLIILGWVVI